MLARGPPNLQRSIRIFMQSWCAFALTLLLRATWLEETIRALDRAARHIPSEGEIPSVRSRVTGEIGLKRLSVQSECRTLGYQPNSYSRSDQAWAGGLLASNRPRIFIVSQTSKF